MSECTAFVQEIERRFGNKILPYRPHPLNDFEIRALLDMQWIHLNDLGNCLIIVNRKVVGEVLKSTHPLFHNRW